MASPELETLGLGRYAELFAAHGIDVDVLADLTDQDLEKLGLGIGDPMRSHQEPPCAQSKKAWAHSQVEGARLSCS
jgi:hypothetical protein